VSVHVPLHAPVFVQVSGNPPPITHLRVADPLYGMVVGGSNARVRVGFWSSTVTLADLIGVDPPSLVHWSLYVLVLVRLFT